MVYKRLILKTDDVLVVHVPEDYFKHREVLASIYRQIRQKLLDANKKNKIIVLPQEIKMSVIGKEKIKEHVSNIDLWNLFDEEGGEDDRDISG